MGGQTVSDLVSGAVIPRIGVGGRGGSRVGRRVGSGIWGEGTWVFGLGYQGFRVLGYYGIGLSGH